jgi:hypothetical protein
MEDERILNSVFKRIGFDNDEEEWDVSSGIIDVFNHCLSPEECDNVSFAYEDLHYRHEMKFIRLAEDLFDRMRDKKIVVMFDFFSIPSSKHLAILEDLNPLEKIIWMDIIQALTKQPKTHYFEIASLEVLKTLIYINIREAYFMKFEFLEWGVALRGSYDCSMLIYFKDNEALEKMKALVQRNKLHIRDITYRKEVVPK